MSAAAVLIVEDSPTVLARLKELATDCGLFVAATADTEDGGLKAIEDGATFSIAIVDLQLASGTGFGVIRRLRASCREDPCAVIVFTNHAVPALRHAAFEAGVDYFLDKSKDFLTLHNLLREISSGERAA